MKKPEHILQVNCVKWFRYAYPQYRKLLVAVPNGGFRHYSTAQFLKAEGVISGVTDLVLFVPSKGFHGYAIEMKMKPNKPTPAQVEWMDEVKEQGYNVAVCYAFDDFKELIDNYLK